MRRLFLSVLLTAAALAATQIVQAAPIAPAKVQPVMIPITVDKGRIVGGTKRPKVKKGRLVRIVITTNVGEDVHLHGYELERPVLRGKKVVIQFTARLAGRFELEMHHPDLLLALLTVTP